MIVADDILQRKLFDAKYTFCNQKKYNFIMLFVVQSYLISHSSVKI